MLIVDRPGDGATVGSMTAKVEKLSVSLGTEEAAWAREQAEASGSSVSAVLTEALRKQRQNLARRRLLDELGTDDITEEDLAAIRAEWRQ
jgi:hypothetical protein